VDGETVSGDLTKQAEAAMGRGDLFSAYDAATVAIEGGSNDPRFNYIQVLALARMGDLDQARQRYESYGLAASQNVDIASLGARLLKDAALSRLPRDRQALLAASDAYGAIYARTGDSFPGVNAATLALLAGAKDRARAIAERLLTKPLAPQTYFAGATRAEALLICGRADEACREIAIACALPDADPGARATTHRQFAVLSDHLALSQDLRAALLAPLEPPRVFMFCGHMIPGDDPAAEAALAESVNKVLDEEDASIAYGALASGSDIVIAEQLLKRGSELNVVLPFHAEDFIQQSVRPAGESWVSRFRACLGRAQTVTFATDMPYMDDPGQFTYGSVICMGLARLRAQHLSADVMQFAVWDGVAKAKDSKAGTAVDVANWNRAGGRARVIAPTWPRLSSKQPWLGSDAHREREACDDGDEVTRELRAMIFTDFRGFTKLQESVLPVFWKQVMRRMMRVLDRHRDAICYRNTWGDALYSVIVDTRHAAALALELQDSLKEVDHAALGIDDEPHMRIGAHYGPVYRAKEGASGALNYYGTQVSRTARIEPVTPPGAVYVTEQFAAALAMEAPDDFVCRYVGPIQLAKGYGALRMYLLKRAG